MLTQSVIDINLDRNLGDIDDIDVKNKPNPIRHLWLYIPSVLLLLFVEFLGTHLFYTERISLQFALIMHLCVVVYCLGWVVVRNAFGQNINIPVMALTLISVTGLMGAFVILLIVVIMGLTPNGGTPFSQWYYSLFPDETKSKEDELYERLYHGLDDLSDKTGVVSFDDVIKLGTYRQKQEAISKIVNHYHPDFANTLKTAINDPMNSVRVQAATAISKVLDTYVQLHEKLMVAREKYPKNHKVLINLARHTHAYANCGLLEPERTRALEEDALRYFQEYLALYPDDVHALYFVGEIYLYKNQFEEALSHIRRSLELRPEGKLNPILIRDYCEALFRLHNLEGIREAVQRYLPRMDVENQKAMDVTEMLEAWDRGIPFEKLRVGG